MQPLPLLASTATRRAWTSVAVELIVRRDCGVFSTATSIHVHELGYEFSAVEHAHGRVADSSVTGCTWKA